MSTYDAETKMWNGLKIPYPCPMDVTFGELVLENLSKNPQRILQICAEDDTELSCEQLRISSIRVAQNLQKIGIQEDDIIGLITHHSHFATCFITGCILVGSIINPLDGQMSEEDISHVYSESKPKIIVCDSEVIAKVQRALKDVDFDYRIYSSTDALQTDHVKADTFLKPTGDEHNFQCPRFSKPADSKILMMLCSSGTTGRPKSISTCHATSISLYSLSSIFSAKGPPSRSTLFSPLYWVSGFFAHIGISFTHTETRILTARKFSVDTFIEIVEKYRITDVFMAPYALNTILSSQKFLSSQNESLQQFNITGAILSQEARKNFDELLPNRKLTIFYGMTEQPMATSKPLEYRHCLAVGSLILPNVSIKIADDDGNALPIGQTGEICSKSAFKFLGYYKNPEATEQLLDKYGFIKTGDIGYFNDEGILFVVDRKKDILKYKGLHVNPSEIENVIESMDGVQAVSVVGIPDELCVNLLTAAIVKRDGYEQLTEREIIEFVASKLPEYKQLSGGVYFFEKLPTTLNDKILKRKVLEDILLRKH